MNKYNIICKSGKNIYTCDAIVNLTELSLCLVTMTVVPSLHCVCVSFFSMYYYENADLSDGDDGELLPLDTEVGTDGIEVGSDDDQENQADAVASAATTTTAASEEEEGRPEFGPHRKLSRGEDLFEFRKEVEMVKEKKYVCSLELFLDYL